MKADNFISIPFTHSNLDLYVARTSILKALNWALPLLSGELLDIGCGRMPYREFMLKHGNVTTYTGLDIENALAYDQTVKPDYQWNGIEMPFEDCQFDCAFGTEVLEHCPEPEVVLKETYRVIRQGGLFFFTVPFLWNLHEVPHDEYRYTPFSMERHLRNSGFINIEIHAMGGWHLAMAQMLGLWLKRSNISGLKGHKEKILRGAVSIAMKKLIKLSRWEKINFTSGQMVTGLYGLARKK